MSPQVQTKHVNVAALLLAIAEDKSRFARREMAGPRWYERLGLPEKVVLAKAVRLVERGVLEYGTSLASSWILSPDQWDVTEAERAAWTSALSAEGYTFGDYMLEDRPADIAEGERKDEAARQEEERLRTCTPTTLEDYLKKSALLTMDACVADFEAYLMTGSTKEQA